MKIHESNKNKLTKEIILEKISKSIFILLFCIVIISTLLIFLLYFTEYSTKWFFEYIKIITIMSIVFLTIYGLIYINLPRKCKKCKIYMDRVIEIDIVYFRCKKCGEVINTRFNVSAGG